MLLHFQPYGTAGHLVPVGRRETLDITRVYKASKASGKHRAPFSHSGNVSSVPHAEGPDLGL